MRKLSFWTPLLALVFFGSQFSFAAYSANPPEVLSCSISPHTLPANGGSLKVSIHIVSQNGLDGTPVAVTDNVLGNSRTLFFGALSLNSGNINDGVWERTFVIGDNLMPGEYRLSLYPLSDKSQNSTGFIHCDSEIVAYGVSPTISPTPLASKSATPLPVPTVTVTATPLPAPTVTVTATPLPAPTVTVTATPLPAPTVTISVSESVMNELSGLKDQYSKLFNIYTDLVKSSNSLKNKLNSICRAKQKPKGC